MTPTMTQVSFYQKLTLLTVSPPLTISEAKPEGPPRLGPSELYLVETPDLKWSLSNFQHMVSF